MDEPEHVDATFEESLDVPRTPEQGGASSHQRHVQTEPHPRGHRRMHTSPDVVGRPTSASETRTSMDSTRRSSPAFRAGKRTEVSYRADDQSALTAASHTRFPVRVVARVRPLLFNEAADREIVFVNGEKVVLVNPATKGDAVAAVAMAARATAENMQADHFARAFMFDDCFWASSQASPDEGNVTQVRSPIAPANVNAQINVVVNSLTVGKHLRMPVPYRRTSSTESASSLSRTP